MERATSMVAFFIGGRMAEENTATEISEESNQPEVTEISQSVDQPEATSEAAVDSQSTAESTTDNWWDTNGLDEPTARKIKDIQTQYNKKSEELKQARGSSEKLTQVEQQLNYVTENVRNAILSPNWQEEVEKARLQLMGQVGPQGVQGAQQKSEMPTPKRLESSDDLMEYLDQRDHWREDNMRKEYDQKLAAEIQRISAPIARDRWSGADRTMKEKYGEVWDKHSQRILNAVATGPFQGLVNKGMDEKQVLESAFLSMATDDLLERAKQDALKSGQKKKEAATEKPRKSTPTSPEKKQGRRSKQDMIADMRRDRPDLFSPR